MDETSYSDQGVIDRINVGYIAVRVDSDRRPDVNDRYTWGGWPTTAILGASGEILAAGGYLGVEELCALLDRVARWYRDHEGDLRQEMVDLDAHRAQLLQCVALPERPPSTTLLEEVERDLWARYDRLYGGFDHQPKFPHADAVRFALLKARDADGEGWEEMPHRSLASMSGALLDPVEGGFFHSANQRDWTDPQTEKLLGVNADLLRLYLEAYEATGHAQYRAVAERVLDYLHSTLRIERPPAFGGSQAADTEYYRLNGRDRDKVTAPPADRTVFAGENGQTAYAYLLAFELLGHQGHLKTATELLDFLWHEMSEPTHGLVRYWNGRPSGPHLLNDQTMVGLAMAEAYDVTGVDDFLEKATILAEVILRDYAGTPGGFYDILAEPEPVGGLANRQWKLTDNAHVAQLMVRLSHFGGDGRYLDAAHSALQLFAEEYGSFGAMEGSYALALYEYVRGKTREEF